MRGGKLVTVNMCYCAMVEHHAKRAPRYRGRSRRREVGHLGRLGAVQTRSPVPCGASRNRDSSHHLIRALGGKKNGLVYLVDICDDNLGLDQLFCLHNRVA